MNKIIRSVGSLSFTSNLVDGKGMRVTNEFLTLLVEHFARQSCSCKKKIGFFPFVHKERQIHSVLAPAISKISSAFLMELPTTREWSSITNSEQDDSHGWIDYWCYYRNIVFLIEVKHDFLSAKSGKPTEKAKEHWYEAIEQLNAIKSRVKEDAAWCKGAIRVALHILPLYGTVNKGMPTTMSDYGHLLEIQNNTMNAFGDNPNWSAMWRLHDKHTGPYEYKNGTEYHPGVLFIAKVFYESEYKKWGN